MAMPPTIDSKPFEPGTTGWVANDLDDPRIERQWFAGRYEIVEGVLAKRPPGLFAGGASLCSLMFVLQDHIDACGPNGDLAPTIDIILNDMRVVVADAVFLTIEDQERQHAAATNAGRPDPLRTRILIPPTLVVESVNPGHELHDRRTKRAWYAEFGVPNYWILDAYTRRLECLALRSGAYVTDAKGENAAELCPAAFPNLRIKLGELWGD